MTPPAAAKRKDPIDFDAASMAVQLARLEGDFGRLDSQVAQQIQTLTGSYQGMQADIQRMDTRSAENHALLQQLLERSTGLERLSRALEVAGTTNAGEATKVTIELSHMRGFIRGVMLCGALGFGTLGAFVIYRMDKTDDAINALREVVRIYHPTAVETIGAPKP